MTTTVTNATATLHGVINTNSTKISFIAGNTTYTLCNPNQNYVLDTNIPYSFQVPSATYTVPSTVGLTQLMVRIGHWQAGRW